MEEVGDCEGSGGDVFRFKTPTVSSVRSFKDSHGRKGTRISPTSPKQRRSSLQGSSIGAGSSKPTSPERWERAPSEGSWPAVAEEDAREVSIRVEHVDSFILGKDKDSEEFQSAQRDLMDLWDASAESDAACVAIASSRPALELLLKLILPRDRINELTREAAVNILVNTSSVVEGGAALLAHGKMMAALVGVVSLLHQPSPKLGAPRSIEMVGAGSMAIKAVVNILATDPERGVPALMQCKGIGAVVKAISATHDSEDGRRHSAELLGIVCSTQAGEEEVLRLGAHRMLLMMLLEPGVSVRDFVDREAAGIDQFFLEECEVKEDQAARRPTPVQEASLCALRALSGCPRGRGVLQKELVPRWIRALSAFTTWDSPTAVEDACAIICNVTQSSQGQTRILQCPGAVLRLIGVLNVSFYCKLGWGGPAYACGALGNLALSEDGALSLLEHGAHVHLAALLHSVDERVQEAAALALVNIGSHTEGRDALNDETECHIPALELLRGDGFPSQRLRSYSASLIRQLTACDSGSRVASADGLLEAVLEALVDAGVPPKGQVPEAAPTVRSDDRVRAGKLVAMLGGALGTWRRHLAGIVRNVTSFQPEGVWRLLSVGKGGRGLDGTAVSDMDERGGKKEGRKKQKNWAVGHIMELAKGSDASLAADAVGVIGNMACIAEGCEAVADHGAVRLVVDSLGGNNGLHEAAVFTLRQLMGDGDAEKILEARRSVWQAREKGNLAMHGHRFVGLVEGCEIKSGEEAESDGEGGGMKLDASYSLALTGGEEYSEGAHFLELE